MLVMFILGLILIGMIAVAAQGLSSMYSVINDLDSAQQERQIEMLWESSVSSLLAQAGPQGEYIAPLGSPLVEGGSGVTAQGLPANVSGPRVNSRGYSPLYCALGRASLNGVAPVTNVILEPGISYDVETLAVGNVEYVTRSSDIPGMERGSTSIVAFIISPLEKSTGISCADIRYDQASGHHSIPNLKARIIAIYGANGGTLSAAEAINRSSSQFIEASNFSSINEALAPFLANPPRRLVVNLPNKVGGYVLNGDLAIGSILAQAGSEVVFSGPQSGQAVISGSGVLQLSNTNVTFSHVATNLTIMASDASLKVQDSALGALTATKSKIQWLGSNSAAGAIFLDGTDVDQTGSLDLAYGDATSGPVRALTSTWKSRQGYINFSAPTALYALWADQASRITLTNSTLTFASNYSQVLRVAADSNLHSIDSSLILQGAAGTFLDLKGRGIFEGGSAQAAGMLGSGAVLRDGGFLLMDNGQQWFYGGFAPVVGISDEGGLGIAGFSAVVGGQSCWSGYLFSDSAANQVTNNNNKNLNGRVTASWSCN